MRENSEEIRGKSIEKKIRQKNRENSVKMNQNNFWKFGGKIGEKKISDFFPCKNLYGQFEVKMKSNTFSP